MDISLLLPSAAEQIPDRFVRITFPCEKRRLTARSKIEPRKHICGHANPRPDMHTLVRNCVRRIRLNIPDGRDFSTKPLYTSDTSEGQSPFHPDPAPFLLYIPNSYTQYHHSAPGLGHGTMQGQKSFHTSQSDALGSVQAALPQVFGRVSRTVGGVQ